MPRPRRSFTPEYRVEAAHRVIDRNRRVAEVARELDLQEHLLHEWVADERRRMAAAGGGGGPDPPDHPSGLFVGDRPATQRQPGRVALGHPGAQHGSHVAAVDDGGQCRAQPVSHLRVTIDRARGDVVVEAPWPQHQPAGVDASLWAVSELAVRRAMSSRSSVSERSAGQITNRRHMRGYVVVPAAPPPR
jgi:transposase